ncbi:MAG: hypothetical protein ACYDCK_06545, partial [Thermoplasmatota archaeon]
LARTVMGYPSNRTFDPIRLPASVRVRAFGVLAGVLGVLFAILDRVLHVAILLLSLLRSGFYGGTIADLAGACPADRCSRVRLSG